MGLTNALVRLVTKLFICVLPFAICLVANGDPGAPALTPSYYSSCPQVEAVIEDLVAAQLKKNPKVAATLLRLHFHDCFVNGCDASVLLETDEENAEKDAGPNLTLGAFEFIDSVKEALEAQCPQTVSCADILVLTTKAGIALAGGPKVPFLLGRRDGTDSLDATAKKFLPPHTADVDGLLKIFQAVNLGLDDIVPLSGAHTFGVGHCGNILESDLNDPLLNTTYAAQLKTLCPSATATLAVPQQPKTDMDAISPVTFDNKYFVNLLAKRGLFHSDRILTTDNRTASTVAAFAQNQTLFFERFTTSLLRMSELLPLTGTAGEIRQTCRHTNAFVAAHPSLLGGDAGISTDTAVCTFSFKGEKLPFDSCTELEGGFTLAWTTTATGELSVALSAQHDGWIGFGFGQQMVGSQPFVAYVDGADGAKAANYILKAKDPAQVLAEGTIVASKLEAAFEAGTLKLVVTWTPSASELNLGSALWAKGAKAPNSGTALLQHAAKNGRLGTVNFLPGTRSLKADFYAGSCPQAQDIIQSMVKAELARNPKVPAPLLRLHFHDCFVNGCDASVLLESPSEDAEKDAGPNLTLGAFQFVDGVKAKLEEECPGVVSCADLLALASAFGIEAAGGPALPELKLGRRDGLQSLNATAVKFLPPHTADVSGLIKVFQGVKLSFADLVPLSGAHTFGIGHCSNILESNLSDPLLNKTYAGELQKICPAGSGKLGVPLQPTTGMDAISPLTFDNKYFVNLLAGRGLFHSDRILVEDPRTADIVKQFAENQDAFFEAFARSVTRMSELAPLTGSAGEVRKLCRYTNAYVEANPQLLGNVTRGSCTFSFGGASVEYDGCTTLGGGFTLMWSVPQPGQLKAALSAQHGGWIGFGFGTQMIGSQPFIAYVDGTGAKAANYLLKGKSSDAVVPEGRLAPSQLEAAYEAGTLKMMVTWTLPAEQLSAGQIIWAKGTKDANSGAGLGPHADKDGRIGVVNFLAQGLGASVEGKVDQKTRNLRLAHGILQVVSFGILLPIATFAPRFFSETFSKWYQIHIAMAVTATVLGYAGFAIGIVIRDRVKRTFTSHFILGIVASSLIALQIIGTFAKPALKAPRRPQWTFFHHWTGRIAIFLGIWNIYIGFNIIQAHPGYKIAYSVVLAMGGLVWLYLQGKTVYWNLVGDIRGDRVNEKPGPVEVRSSGHLRMSDQVEP